jgi:hypothetical protein
MSDQTGKPSPDGSDEGGGGQAPGLDTKHAHSARVYNYWLGGKDNYPADQEAAEQAIAANPGIVADVRANRAFLARADDPYGMVATLVQALPAGSYLVLAHPASDIRAAKMAEMTRRVNERMSGPRATMRDRDAITRFFDGLDLVEPGVVQPQQWRPDPGALSPLQVTAWCGVARKP